jgi:phospholipid/cholesterol/gamma-HCH transport system substrate-binding protein
MEQSKRELQVGLTVIVAVAILAVGFLWFEQVRLGGDAEVYAVDFTEVAGLQVGDRVQVRGIRMGTVKNFELLGDIVRVEFELERDVDLREDATVGLKTKGIVGEVLIDIKPGSGAPVEPGHIFKGESVMTLEKVTAAAGEAMEKVVALTEELQSFITQLRSEGRLVESLNELHKTIAEVSGLVAENRVQTRELLEDLGVSAAALRDALADSSLNRLVTRSELTMTRADTLLQRASSAAARLDTLLATAEAGEGTVGRIWRDESLYVQADSTLISLKRLLDELRRNPKRYFKVSVLDF